MFAFVGCTTNWICFNFVVDLICLHFYFGLYLGFGYLLWLLFAWFVFGVVFWLTGVNVDRFVVFAVGLLFCCLLLVLVMYFGFDLLLVGLFGCILVLGLLVGFGHRCLLHFVVCYECLVGLLDVVCCLIVVCVCFVCFVFWWKLLIYTNCLLVFWV